MATPVFSINGGPAIPGVVAAWWRVEKRRTPTGIVWQDYALHTWDIAQMEMSVFETLRGMQGTVLASLATTHIEDINNGEVYTDVEIVSVVNGQQVGRRMTNIRVEFKVAA